MKKVLLRFPDSKTATDFITQYKIASAVVGTNPRFLTAILNHEQIVAACTKYEAILQRTIISY